MHSRFFRGASVVVLMAVLLLAYAAHPVAGWTTLVALASVLFWKKARPAVDSNMA